MKAQGGGAIVNIASMSGLIVNRPQMQTSYNTSKAGVIHLTRSLAVEWAPYHIRVNAIAPGYINTAMTDPPLCRPELRRGMVPNSLPCTAPVNRWNCATRDPVDLGSRIFHHRRNHFS